MTLKRELTDLQIEFAMVDFVARRGRPGRIEVLLLRLQSLKLKMYQEKGHHLPHIHVDYGNTKHAASYSISDGLRIEGNLSTKYDKVVSEWVLLHRDKLIETWKQLQAGDDVTKLIESLAGKPEYKKVIRPQNPAEL